MLRAIVVMFYGTEPHGGSRVLCHGLGNCKWRGDGSGCAFVAGLVTDNKHVALCCLTRSLLFPLPHFTRYYTMEHFSMTITTEFTPQAPQLFNPTTPCKFSQPLPHTPSRSSPLSVRPQKIVAELSNLKMLPSPPSSPPDFLAPKRLFKSVPVVSREKGREARRNLFLKKVRTGREDKIIKSRGGEDEVLTFFSQSEQ